MFLLLLAFKFFTLNILTQTDATLLVNFEDTVLHNINDSSSTSYLLQLNASCLDDDGQVKENFCYIEGECYYDNQTRLNSSLACLQCRSKLSQTYWSIKQSCSAGLLCLNRTFIEANICNKENIRDFYVNHEVAITKHYDFRGCNQKDRQCQAGFFFIDNNPQPMICCPGFFCPEGQRCMIPCRQGAYCPSPWPAINGTCVAPVTKCPQHQAKDYEYYGCGGSSRESYCPAQSYCQTSALKQSCVNNTNYCPIGTDKELPCPSGFTCTNGTARRTRLLVKVVITVLCVVLGLTLCAELMQWLVLKKKLLGQYEIIDPPGVSDYFREHNEFSQRRQHIQLHIHLNRAKLRNVTRFNSELNEGFTGRISAGKITALMGGSGCGKSSLLETIHGRRRLQRDGYITFADYEPLSNELTDYIGYVPQADIMHNDLTVFETVYYSARARRLNESNTVITNDVCFVLEKLGLKIMHNNLTKTLSGGQRKRVNVAMEVAACPKVLLLDEPTSGLDTASCDDLFDLLQLIKYSAAGPVTIITVIHQPSQELFEKIDDIFFLTPLCCLAYQGPRDQAKEFLKQKIFSDSDRCPAPRHNDCDTCFIMLTKAQEHIENHSVEDERIQQQLTTTSIPKRLFLPFFYVFLRCGRQIYIRGAVVEALYLLAYFVLGSCIGYLFENAQQDECDIKSLPTIYFLMSLAYGILTCISSQRLFGVEITDQTFERESRNYYHPFQYWLAKSLVDIVRLILYPLLFLSMMYIEIVPRGAFSYYFGVLLLLSFVCSAIGQLASVIFNRTEYAYLAGTIVALLSCLLSGFSPPKEELGGARFITTISFSRHIQNLLFSHETSLYFGSGEKDYYIWSIQIAALRKHFSFEDNEHPYFWLLFIGFFLRALTLLFLYGKSEYRSRFRFHVTHAIPFLMSLCNCRRCRKSCCKQTYFKQQQQQQQQRAQIYFSESEYVTIF